MRFANGVGVNCNFTVHTSTEVGKEILMQKAHIVENILPGSIAAELEIGPGDKILSINSTEIEDIFDYQFLVQDTYIEVLVEKPDGEQWLLEVDKDPGEDLGIEFENGLMDEYRHCHNKCVFCFIDQMPPGMRENLYFKDDDSRLSFLQGNYVTLTNMSDHDIDRICRYRLSPINISFQTMNPELRCRMLNNRFAGKALKKVDTLFQADIHMNGQIVLCKGLNDGKELKFSIEQLMKYIPVLESLSVVPVGLTKYREGLYPLDPFAKEDAAEVIDIIEEYQKECYEKHGIHFVHASDEWYILAGRDVPEEERYDGYLQLENGVGMLRLLLNEFDEAMEQRREQDGFPCGSRRGELAMATGLLAYPYIQNMADKMADCYPNVRLHVYPISNFFFGEQITVSGLITGQDLQRQLAGKKLGTALLLPENMVRVDTGIFLDDISVKDIEKALQVPVDIVKSSGYDFVETVLAHTAVRE